MVTGQALVAGVDFGLDLRVAAEQVFDAVGAQRGDVVHPAGPERAQPQQPPVPSLTAVELMVFRFFWPDTNARRPGPARPGAAHLHLGAVDLQLDALGGGVGEHISQRLQPQPGLAGHANPRAASSGRISPAGG